MSETLLRLCAAAALLAASAAHGHGGGLNADGCHNNRKTGDYHCHRAQVSAVPQQAPARLPAQPEMPRGAPQQQLALNASMPASAAGLSVATQPTRSTLPPGCFVGPRGGTYTITKSGRKNYGGC
jgi:hypothetical protein